MFNKYVYSNLRNRHSGSIKQLVIETNMDYLHCTTCSLLDKCLCTLSLIFIMLHVVCVLCRWYLLCYMWFSVIIHINIIYFVLLKLYYSVWCFVSSFVIVSLLWPLYWLSFLDLRLWYLQVFLNWQDLLLVV